VRFVVRTQNSPRRQWPRRILIDLTDMTYFPVLPMYLLRRNDRCPALNSHRHSGASARANLLSSKAIRFARGIVVKAEIPDKPMKLCSTQGNLPLRKKARSQRSGGKRVLFHHWSVRGHEHPIETGCKVYYSGGPGEVSAGPGCPILRQSHPSSCSSCQQFLTRVLSEVQSLRNNATRLACRPASVSSRLPFSMYHLLRFPAPFVYSE
jgi:hypothetical protein